MTLNDKIITLINKGNSYRKLAKLLNVSSTTISRWYHKEYIPSEENEKNINSVYNFLINLNKFKIGDRIRFKSWEKLIKEYPTYGDEETGYLAIETRPWSFISAMKRLCGTCATIKDIYPTNEIKLIDFELQGYDIFKYCIDMVENTSEENNITLNTSKNNNIKFKCPCCKTEYNINVNNSNINKNKFTNIEISLLKHVSDRFNYIGRDKDGNLYLYNNKPKKGSIMYYSQEHFGDFNIYKDLFKNIKWKDKDVTNFRQYLEEN